MKATITVHCEAPGCAETVSAEWPINDEWWAITNSAISLDGRAPLDAEGWDMPGPFWSGTDQATLCPLHARAARKEVSFTAGGELDPNLTHAVIRPNEPST